MAAIFETAEVDHALLDSITAAIGRVEARITEIETQPVPTEIDALIKRDRLLRLAGEYRDELIDKRLAASSMWSNGKLS